MKVYFDSDNNAKITDTISNKILSLDEISKNESSQNEKLSFAKEIEIAKRYIRKFKNEKTCTPTIDDNVTIFANAVLLGDIKIGKNAIIGTGSVVLNDVGENCIAAGNPAKVIKKI